MSQTAICKVLIAADEPMLLEDLAKRAGVEKNNASAVLYNLSQAGVVERTGEQRPYSWRVKNVDEAKKRASGAMKAGGRKPKEAAPDKPAKAKRRKPVKTKPTKRRATKRVAREASTFPADRYQKYIDQDGDLQIIDRENPDIAITMERSEVWTLANFLVGMRHLIEPKRGRKGARR